MVADKRQHLRNYPASCSARIGREQAFDAIYELGPYLTPSMTRAEIDAKYRDLEDYVFAELEYEQSRTCCWNSTHSGMFQLIMELNQAIIYDEESRMCQEPIVFKMVDGDYAIFKDYAASVDASHMWVEWSADESCPQAETVMTDTEVAHEWVTFCELASEEEPEPVEPEDTEPEDTEPDDTEPEDTEPDDTEPEEPESTDPEAPSDDPDSGPIPE